MSHDGERQDGTGEGAPQASRVTEGQPAPKGKKLTRAERREERRLLKAQVEVAEIAASQVPPGFAVRGLDGSVVVGEGAPPGFPVTEVIHRESEEEREKRKKQETDSVMGRPSEYTQEEADAICAWIAGGASLMSYCRARGRSMLTVYRWLREHADFHARYAQAHEDRADTLTDEMIEIADEAAQDATIEDVQAAKLRVETRRWIAMKLKPQRWGDKQIVQHQGAVSIRIGIPQKQQPLDMVDVVENRATLPAQQATGPASTPRLDGLAVGPAAVRD